MWVKIDDDLPSHPKQIAIGKDGRALWLVGLCYANKNNTDGFVPDFMIPKLAALAEIDIDSTLKTLTTTFRPNKNPVWHRVDGGYQIHDYADFQLTVERQEEIKAKKAEAGRQGGLRSGEARRSKNEADAQASAIADAEASAIADAEAKTKHDLKQSRGGRIIGGGGPVPVPVPVPGSGPEESPPLSSERVPPKGGRARPREEGPGRNVPPSPEEVKVYFLKMGDTEQEAELFYAHHDNRRWIPKGYSKPMKSWHHAVTTWRSNKGKYSNSTRGSPIYGSLQEAADNFHIPEHLNALFEDG